MKKNLISLIAFLILLFTACGDDDWRNPSSGGNSFNLSYTVSDPTVVLSKSSVGIEEGEDRVNSFYVLFFENTTGGTGQFLDAIDAMGGRTSLASTGDLQITFPEDSELDNSNEYKLLLCANIEEYSVINSLEELKTFCDGKTEKDVISLLLRISGVDPVKTPEEEQKDDSNSIPATNLPMSTSLVKQAKAESVIAELTRVVSRFDVYCQAEGYELVSASVWNAYTAAYLWDGSLTNFSGIRTERFYGVKANNKEIIGSLYAFENYVREPRQTDKLSTCLIIGLKNLNTGDIEYFRTNVNASGTNGQQLSRNSAYTTIVKSVLNTGDETERGAYENERLLLDIDVEGWITDNNGIIQYDGEYMLAVSVSNLILSSQGDKREFYIYTLGGGNPPVINSNTLPKHIIPKLELAPGYSPDAKFQASILTINATGGTTSERGTIGITFNTAGGYSMNATIGVEQKGEEGDFLNLNQYELPVFSSNEGEESEEIIVTSSGSWIAEIVYGEHFSFEGNSLKTELTGDSGQGFKIYTTSVNTKPEVRYCLVQLSLSGKPDVKRVVALRQAAWDKQYIILNPTLIPDVYSMGGSTEIISVQSNGNWKAILTMNEYGDAGFNGDVSEKVISGYGNGYFSVYFAPLEVSGISPRATITVTIVDETIVEESITVAQQQLKDPGLQVWTNANGVGNLSPSTGTNTNYTRYVYNLGENMRNPLLFGSRGTVRMPGSYAFKQATITDKSRVEANIYQLTSNPTAAVMTILKKAMDTDPTKLLIITSNSSSVQKSILARYENIFSTSYYSNYVVNTSISNNTERVFNPNLDMNDPVVAVMVNYLLNGPFSGGNAINKDNIKLKSTSTNCGFSIWPNTLIPIITDSEGKYCLFGIDPINRIIWMGDPGIFGASTSQNSTTYPNQQNYTNPDSENSIFLNNIIAWLTNAALYGDSFLKDFR